MHCSKVATFTSRIPLAGGLGPVLEDVAEVGAAVPAHHLRPDPSPQPHTAEAGVVRLGLRGMRLGDHRSPTAETVSTDCPWAPLSLGGGANTLLLWNVVQLANVGCPL